MADTTVQDQPEVAVPAVEAQPVQESTPAAANADNDTDKQTEVAAETQNGTDNMLKTTTQPDHKNFRKNRKYDPSTQPVTDDPIKIRGQVIDHPLTAHHRPSL